MKNYFETTKLTKLKGRPKTTLPTTLSQDIKGTKLQQLKNKKDLEKLRKIAMDFYP